MTYVARNDQSVIGNWWREVDRGLIWTVLSLIFAGWIIIFTGSAQEALQDAQPLLNFTARKLLIAFAAVILLFGFSLLKPEDVERLTKLGFAVALLFLISLFFFGISKNGATRWIAIPGVPFFPQPTEFAKPFMVLMIAFCLSQARTWGFMRAFLGAAATFGVTAGLVLMQPDVSQTAFLLLLFLALLFLGGLALEWVIFLFVLGAVAMAGAYLVIDHVRYRIDGFISRIAGTDGDLRDHNDMAEDAFRNGGIEGLGLGEGRLKTFIPEAKNDMPLAIIGEEMGLIGALVVFAFFLLIWTRTQSRLSALKTDFQRLGAAGLAFLLLAQALINISYTVGLIPTTGITLPFFSDGGSSLIASAMAVGLLLALTRHRGVRV